MSFPETLEEELRVASQGGELRSTFDGIVQSCPRIRILLLGKSGVGKSSLINAIFGEPVAEVVQGNEAGVCDINTEIPIRNRGHIVLHDSQGFSPGDDDNFNTVKRFVDYRSKLRSRDKLHAIWLCLQTPAYGGSLIQACDEEILKYADSKGVPIIIVFTQFDKLVANKRLKAMRARSNVKVTTTSVIQELRKQYETQLEFVAKYHSVFVSVKPEPQYDESRIKLVQLTEQVLRTRQESQLNASYAHQRARLSASNIYESSHQMDDFGSQRVARWTEQMSGRQQAVQPFQQPVGQNPYRTQAEFSGQRPARWTQQVYNTVNTPQGASLRPVSRASSARQASRSAEDLSSVDSEDLTIVWASVQCPDIDLKVAASIQVGRKKYWRGLSTSFKFPGHTLDKFLKVVHKDIIRTWAFEDPGLLLESHIMTKGMSDIQTDLVDDTSSNTARHISFGTATAVVTVVSALMPPVAPFVAPIAGGLVFADWVYCVFETTPQTLRAIMGYIIDLTIVMQRLFFLTKAKAAAEAAKSRTSIAATVSLDTQLIESAFNSYTDLKDGHKNAVHSAIREFASVRNALKRELVLQTISDLIDKYRYQPAGEAAASKEQFSGRSSASSTSTLVEKGGRFR